MAVPMYDFEQLHHAQFRDEIKNIFSHIIDSNSFVEGEYNDKFELAFAKKQAAKHCLLVANGTDALEISLLALGIGHGDKVGIPGITFYATAEAVLNCGAEPIFVDVDPETSLMCPHSLSEVLKDHQLKAIIPVHIYGMPAPIKELGAICKQNNIAVIEDAAQAQGGYYEHLDKSNTPTPIGSSGHLVTFSFYPTKNLSAFGDAGAILTNNDELAAKIKAIRNHGRGDSFIMGRNSRCDHLQAAVLYTKLKEIDEQNIARKKHAQKYHTQLQPLNGIELLPSKFLALSAWHLYPIRLKTQEQRLKLSTFLQSHGVGCIPYYEEALSQLIPLKNFPGPRLNAENWAGKVLCLPIGPFLTDKAQSEVCELIHSSGITR